MFGCMPKHMPQLIFVNPHVYIQIQELLQSIDFYVVVFRLFDFNFALHFDGCDIQAINKLVDGWVPPFFGGSHTCTCIYMFTTISVIIGLVFGCMPFHLL